MTRQEAVGSEPSRQAWRPRTKADHETQTAYALAMIREQAQWAVQQQVIADLRRLAAKIDGEHPASAPFCPCCAEAAQMVRDLATRYEPLGSAGSPTTGQEADRG